MPGYELRANNANAKLHIPDASFGSANYGNVIGVVTTFGPYSGAQLTIVGFELKKP